MKLQAERSHIVVGASLGLLLLAVLSCLLYFWMLRQAYVDEIATVQPRTARLLGMVENEASLAEAGAAAERALTEVAHAAKGDPAATAAALQRDVRRLMTEAGLSISGSQVLDSRSGDGYDQLRLDITAEGNINALDEALLQLEQMRPLVFVEVLRVKPVRSRRRNANAVDPGQGDPRRLNARFSLFSLRLQ